MTETENKTNFREEFEAHLNSPLPLIIRARNFIFGKERPDYYTQFSFYFALVFWFIFFLWSIMGNMVISLRNWIQDEKKINVTELIDKRGIELGFEPMSFMGRLELFHSVSIFFWIATFLGLILLWRKNLKFVYFFFSGAILYLLFMWVMLGFGYWSKDTTLFDKVTFFLMIGHTAVYAFFLKKEKEGQAFSFFGVDMNDDED